MPTVLDDVVGDHADDPADGCPQADCGRGSRSIVRTDSSTTKDRSPCAPAATAAPAGSPRGAELSEGRGRPGRRRDQQSLDEDGDVRAEAWGTHAAVRKTALLAVRRHQASRLSSYGTEPTSHRDWRGRFQSPVPG